MGNRILLDWQRHDRRFCSAWIPLYTPKPIPDIKKYPHILEILTSKTQMQNFLEQSPDKTLILEQGSLYLVDPRDNVIMQYAANANPRGVFKDLEKLLRISQIG